MEDTRPTDKSNRFSPTLRLAVEVGLPTKTPPPQCDGFDHRHPVPATSWVRHFWHHPPSHLEPIFEEDHTPWHSTLRACDICTATIRAEARRHGHRIEIRPIADPFPLFDQLGFDL